MSPCCIPLVIPTTRAYHVHLRDSTETDMGGGGGAREDKDKDKNTEKKKEEEAGEDRRAVKSPGELDR